jgi:hypothetical protein
MKILQIEHSESNDFLDCWTWSKTFIFEYPRIQKRRFLSDF